MRTESRVRIGLRGKLGIAALILTFSPVVAIWPVGVVEDLLQQQMASEVSDASSELRLFIESEHRDFRSGSPDARELEDFAADRHVMIRVIDSTGAVVLSTNPEQANRWNAFSKLWLGMDDFFFGPAGAPDLMAGEARLPPVAKREEVRAALDRRRGVRLHRDPTGRMYVYYVAEPIRDGGVVYTCRLSRRVIRSLYEMRYQLLALSLVLALSSLVLGTYVGQRVVAPLRRIQKSIEAYLRSPGQAPSLALARNDEIGDLSRNFQALVLRLRKQAEDTAETAGDLAHDLKNPIATVAATAELMQSGSAVTPERAGRIAQSLASAALHMNRTVDGLLGLAELEASLTSSSRELVDLRKLILDLQRELELLPQWAEATLAVEARDEAIVVGVSSELERMLLNLLNNALAFCHGRVLVTVDQNESLCTMVVCDDGPGVSEGNRDKVFRRFFSSRPTSMPPGTGLGLATAQVIARSHGGTITLMEDGPLDGACFRVELPRHSP
jgi:signal transduction histidine kinase